MVRTVIRSVVLSLSIVFAPALLSAQRVPTDGPRLSPFRAMKMVAEDLHVQVDDDTWHVLVSVGGVDSKHLVSECRRLCGDQWWKRLTEDLPALLSVLGAPTGSSVDLQLRPAEGGSTLERKAVPMTAENRRQLWQANRVPGTTNRVEPALSVADYQADLGQLRELLDGRYAYRTLREVDLDRLFAEAARRVETRPFDRSAFAREVDTILRALGDGHSRLQSRVPAAGGSFLPFLVQRCSGGHVAFLPDRSGLVDESHPFLEAIDSLPLERWLEASRARGTQGSPAMMAREAERGLRSLSALRQALGQPDTKTVKITLRGPEGTKELELPVATMSPVYGEWPRNKTRMLEGNLGYLRIPRMDNKEEFLAGLDAAMASFAETKALIIDVRGNGGGTRDALLRLFPYLLTADDGPQVVNVAAVLRSTVEEEVLARGFALEDRHLYPADWPGWNDQQRTAIENFARTFQPEWTPPEDSFSPMHYLVIDRTTNTKARPYLNPVFLLIDDGCYSATDIFVAAMRTRPNVKLVGTTTSGGSGRARSYRLQRTGLALQLSSMASFQPDGRLFEGRGIEPDIPCTPDPGDLVARGDAQLKKVE